jgi:hypothetical protein
VPRIWLFWSSQSSFSRSRALPERTPTTSAAGAAGSGGPTPTDTEGSRPRRRLTTAAVFGMGAASGANGWNYWDLSEVYRGAQFADVLHGFENYERIRGCVAPSPHHQWFYCYRWDVGMGGYMRGQLLWWGSSGDSFVYIVDAHTWSGLV